MEVYTTEQRIEISARGQIQGQSAWPLKSRWSAICGWVRDPHLVANECTNCGARFFDRRNACAQCGLREFKNAPGQQRGEIEGLYDRSPGCSGYSCPVCVGHCRN